MQIIESHRAEFGHVVAAGDGQQGVLALTPEFAGTPQDEESWNEAIDWAWRHGYVVEDEPLTTLPSGSVIFTLRHHRIMVRANDVLVESS